jgi:hypothetical protein
MTWSTLLYVPPPWPVSANVDHKSVGRADVADTLKEIRVSGTSVQPTLLLYFFRYNFICLPPQMGSLRHRFK